MGNDQSWLHQWLHQNSAQIDADLTTVVAAWHSLPDSIKAAILTLVDASGSLPREEEQADD